jgi:hypothetical protein
LRTAGTAVNQPISSPAGLIITFSPKPGNIGAVF